MTDRDNAVPTPERGLHDEIEIRDIEGVGKRASVRYPRKIDKYFAQGTLGKTREENATNYDAAVRYLKLSSAAMRGECQSTLGNLHRVDRIGQAPDDGGRTDATIRFARVNRALHPMDAACLIAVVGMDESCDSWLRAYRAQRGKKRPHRREGIFTLRRALGELVRIWGL